jgi:hypothetical protein
MRLSTIKYVLIEIAYHLCQSDRLATLWLTFICKWLLCPLDCKNYGFENTDNSAPPELQSFRIYCIVLTPIEFD